MLGMENFSETLKLYVFHSGRTHKNICQEAGIAQNYLSMMLRNGFLPSPTTLEKLCKALCLNDEKRIELYILAGRVPIDKIERILSKMRP